jgi:UDP-2,4-diacetamido-2,4,6-trideoxy-beta-L-altropyranose hydrolase
MRCLTLANALAEKGAQCVFASRAVPDSLAGMISRQGHRLIALSPAAEGFAPQAGDPVHAAWLGMTQEADAKACLDVVQDQIFDWLVVDHYALDHRFEAIMRQRVARIMVIDDLADRQHDCELLLDQNLGRKAEDYDGLVPDGCERLTGPQFALLRPEFATHRQASLARRAAGQVEHILVSLGGFDNDNVTSKVLDALDVCDLPENCRISVVVGRDAPWLDHLKEKAPSIRWPITVLAGVEDMAGLMASVDLAIGAAGGSAWERCCLGVPTMLMVLAENQRKGAIALEQAGAAFLAPGVSAADDGAFCRCLVRVMQPEKIIGMSRTCADVTDGLGASRVAALLREGAPKGDRGIIC